MFIGRYCICPGRAGISCWSVSFLEPRRKGDSNVELDLHGCSVTSNSMSSERRTEQENGKNMEQENGKNMEQDKEQHGEQDLEEAAD